MIFTFDPIHPSLQHFLFHITSLYSLWLIVVTIFSFTPFAVLCALPSIKKEYIFGFIAANLLLVTSPVSCFILLVYFHLWTICIYFPFPVSEFFWWGVLALENESNIVSINNLNRQNSDKTVNEIGLRRQNFEWDGAYGRHLTIFTNYIWISFSQSLWNFKKVTSVRLQI